MMMMGVNQQCMVVQPAADGCSRWCGEHDFCCGLDSHSFYCSHKDWAFVQWWRSDRVNRIFSRNSALLSSCWESNSPALPQPPTHTHTLKMNTQWWAAMILIGLQWWAVVSWKHPWTKMSALIKLQWFRDDWSQLQTERETEVLCLSVRNRRT